MALPSSPAPCAPSTAPAVPDRFAVEAALDRIDFDEFLTWRLSTPPEQDEVTSPVETPAGHSGALEDPHGFCASLLVSDTEGCAAEAPARLAEKRRREEDQDVGEPVAGPLIRKSSADVLAQPDSKAGTDVAAAKRVRSNKLELPRPEVTTEELLTALRSSARSSRHMRTVTRWLDNFFEIEDLCLPESAQRAVLRERVFNALVEIRGQVGGDAFAAAAWGIFHKPHFCIQFDALRDQARQQPAPLFEVLRAMVGLPYGRRAVAL